MDCLPASELLCSEEVHMTGAAVGLGGRGERRGPIGSIALEVRERLSRNL